MDPKGIEVDAVTAWLATNVGTTAPLTFERLPGGHSNLTYRVTDAGGRPVVLRRPPLGDLLPTAHDMSREHRIISALGPTSVPVAPALGFCDDPEVTGAPFYVMGWVEGHVLHDAKTAESVFDVDQRRVCGQSFIDVLADLHEVVPDEVGLGELGRHEGYLARQLKRWNSQVQAAKTRELPEVTELHDFFAAHVPEQGPARVVHGDYRLGNCLSDTATGHLAAVLDWEIATLGDPLADLGYVLSTWSQPGDPMANPALPSMVEGFPRREELVERYAGRTGRDLSQIDFYIAFSHWKSACIGEGVYARYLHGALDTTGVDLDSFPLGVDRYLTLSAEAAARFENA
jgi:aminoglycoside phosphotransferase (APT) family kinase protein